MNTLLLDTKLWDLCLDVSGNIAMATDPYSAAQDVASAVRTFAGECWYHTDIGVPYFEQVLGHFPPFSLVKALIIKEALRVPGCTKPVVFFTGFNELNPVFNRKDRSLVGQIQFVDTNVNTPKGFPVTIQVGPGIFALGGQIGADPRSYIISPDGGPVVPGSQLGGPDVLT